MISIIIPTYNERGNILRLVSEIEKNLRPSIMNDFEIVVMDDDSPDGTAEAVNGLSNPRARAVNRRGRQRGLSEAVLHGLDEAVGEIVAVMDADFSHPPELLPSLIEAVRSQSCLIAVGSRYIAGGGIHHWPRSRIWASKAACWLARPVTDVKDATSGFFCLRKSILEGVRINPTGFKIGLEVFVKAAHRNKITEVPYFFTDRREGFSKLSTGIMWCYLRQVANLMKERMNKK